MSPADFSLFAHPQAILARTTLEVERQRGRALDLVDRAVALADRRTASSHVQSAMVTALGIAIEAREAVADVDEEESLARMASIDLKTSRNANILKRERKAVSALARSSQHEKLLTEELASLELAECNRLGSDELIWLESRALRIWSEAADRLDCLLAENAQV